MGGFLVDVIFREPIVTQSPVLAKYSAKISGL